MKNLVAKIEQSVGGRDIILILLSSFFYMSGPMMVTPLITGFSGSLGASATLMGLVGGLMNIVSLICRPFAGNLADKISKYKLSFIGATLMTVACFGYAISVNPGMILIARVINGIGYSCCSVCLSTWMSNLLPREKIGSGMGVYGMINALAMALAPALGVILFKNIGYKPAFIVATICAAITVLIIQFVKDKGEPAPKAATDQTKRFAILDINVVPIAIIMMLFTIPYCTTQSFLVSYIATRHLAVNISLYFPAYAVVLLILRLAARNLFDKKPFSFFMILSSISAFFGVLLLAEMRNNLMLILSAAFMAGGYGIMCSVSQSTAILLAGEGKRGLANSTYYVGLDLGMSIGPIFGGFLFGHVAISEFYPILMLSIPLGILIFIVTRKKLVHEMNN